MENGGPTRAGGPLAGLIDSREDAFIASIDRHLLTNPLADAGNSRSSFDMMDPPTASLRQLSTRVIARLSGRPPAMQNDFSSWFSGKEFSTDWTSERFPIFAASLSRRRNKILNVLEIGSWEGRSAIFFLNFFPHSRIVAVDTFAGSPELVENPEWLKAIQDCERRFDANLSEYRSRVEKIKARSCEALPRLATELRRFDFIYVDGSHHSTDVYSDAALCWPMLVRGGVLAFDDYTWDLMKTEAERPKLGIDAFLAGQEGRYRELYRDYIVIVEKH